MTTNSMQNVPRAKYSNITEVIGQIRTTDSCLQDKRYNHYAREPSEGEETEVKHLIPIKFKNNEKMKKKEEHTYGVQIAKSLPRK